MRNQAIQQVTDSGKTGGMPWCALSLGTVSGSTISGLRYLGSKETVISTSHSASAFTANPRNPEADPKAALD